MDYKDQADEQYKNHDVVKALGVKPSEIIEFSEEVLTILRNSDILDRYEAEVVALGVIEVALNLLLNAYKAMPLLTCASVEGFALQLLQKEQTSTSLISINPSSFKGE